MRLGDGISVDILLRFGADANRTDPEGLTPLHWAVVKGNVSCISKIVKSGSDLTKRNNQGVTPLELSKQLNSVHAFQRAMTTLGRFPDGRQKTTSLTTKNTKWAVFLIPTMMVYVALKTFDLLPWYTAGLLVIAELFGGHHVVSRVLTDGQPDVDGIKSPYLAGIVVASLLWVGYTWLTTLIGGACEPCMTVPHSLICVLFSSNIFSADDEPCLWHCIHPLLLQSCQSYHTRSWVRPTLRGYKPSQRCQSFQFCSLDLVHC